MSAYSTFQIGGVDVIFDPDSVNINTQNLIGLNRSMGGSWYATSVSAITQAVNKSVTISGVYLTTSAATALAALATLKTVVTITGGAGAFDLVGLGATAKFIVMNVSHNPMKPKIEIPGYATSVKYSYNISLQGVN